MLPVLLFATTEQKEMKTLYSSLCESESILGCI